MVSLVNKISLHRVFVQMRSDFLDSEGAGLRRTMPFILLHLNCRAWRFNLRLVDSISLCISVFLKSLGQSLVWVSPNFLQSFIPCLSVTTENKGFPQKHLQWLHIICAESLNVPRSSVCMHQTQGGLCW